MKHFSLFLFLHTFFILSSFSQSAGSYYRNGKKEKQAGRIEESIVIFSKAIEIKPKYKYFLARAQANQQAGKNEYSIADYKKCIELEPNEITNYLEAGNLFLTLKKWSEALEILSYPVRQKNIYALRKSAFASIKLKKYNEALELISKISSHDHLAYYYSGIAYDSLRNYEKAIFNYERAIFNKPNYNDDVYQCYFVSFANALVKQGQHHARALTNFQIALNIDKQDKYEPPTSEIYYDRSVAFFSVNDMNKCISDLNDAIAQNSGYKEAFLLRANAYRKIGKFQDAANDYTKALFLDSAYVPAYLGAAECQMEIGKFPEAIKDIKKGLKVFPASNELNFLLEKAEEKLYQVSREEISPVIKLVYPQRDFGNTVYVSSMHKQVVVEGEIQDQSRISFIKANESELEFDKTALNPRFKGKANIEEKEFLTVSATDIYNNPTTVTYPIYRFEMYSQMMVDFSGNLTSYNNNVSMELSNFTVYLCNKRGDVLNKALTDSRGFFRFENLPHDLQYVILLDTSDSRIKLFQKFVIKDKNANEVLVAYADKGEYKFTILPSDRTALALMSYYDIPVTVDLSGKFLLDNAGRSPLTKFTVKLVDKNGVLVATAQTDDNGMFYFKNLPPDKGYVIMLDTDDPRLETMASDVLLMDEKAKTVIKTIRIPDLRNFKFEILPVMETPLAKITEIDPWMIAIQKPELQRDIVIIENIYYELGKFEIPAEAMPVFDKAIDVMNKNKEIRLEIFSHTDSQGSDEFNLTLSEKRINAVMHYLQQKGIEKSRLIGKGMGETLLANHCGNGTDCTDDEHKVNRRTVFRIVHKN